MADTLLERIAEATAERKAALVESQWKDQQWRLLIGAAAKAGLSPADIAASAGISRARVYQIRDDRR